MAEKFFDFLRKKKSDKKFKQAGPGQKLTDVKPQNKSGFLPSFSKNNNQPQPPKEGVRRAGEAALARIEAQRLQNKIPNWSLSAVRAQAMRELDQEAQAEDKGHSGPKLVSQDSAPVLSVSGIYYNCPLVGPDILSKREIQQKIRSFLYEQLEEEPGVTACFIIHTCNQKDKVKQGIETMCKYLSNITEHPDEEKYQKIRMENKVFQEKVLCLEGALEFLLAAGFEQTDTPEGKFLIFKKEKLLELEYLDTLKEALISSEAILPQLDRNTRVLLPLEAHAPVRLPDEFFNLSTMEIKREQRVRTEEVELNTALRTKAMRQRDALKEDRLYRFTLIRIKFPDEIILQGTFSVKEKLCTVIDFVKENLADYSRSFQLFGPGGEKLDCDSSNSTLLELKLIPAAKLHLSWLGDDGEFSKSNDDAFLKPETMALLQKL